MLEGFVDWLEGHDIPPPLGLLLCELFLKITGDTEMTEEQISEFVTNYTVEWWKRFQDEEAKKDAGRNNQGKNQQPA
jgi:hypothetical protein